MFYRPNVPQIVEKVPSGFLAFGCKKVSKSAFVLVPQCALQAYEIWFGYVSSMADYSSVLQN